MPSRSNKPRCATFRLPWLDEEEADLYRLAQEHGRDEFKLREEMVKLGWDRTPGAIADRLQRAFPKNKKVSVPCQDAVEPNEAEILALHKPWRN